MTAALLSRPGSRTLLGQFETATADEAVVELYRAHYAGLVRLSAMLVGDVGTAEEVVQDAFVAMHGSWGRLRDPEKALAYLRQAIVNRSRSALRHRAVVAKYPPARHPTSRVQSILPWPQPNVTNSCGRSTHSLAGSGKPSYCGITPISRRPK